MTMPSGSDPGGYNPNALDGSVVGAGLSALAGRTQAAVTAQQQSNVQGNSTWTNLSDSFFAGLNPDGETPFPLLLIKALADAVGLGGVFNTIEDALSAIGSLIGGLSSAFNQVLEILGGLIVTPVNAAVQLVKDAWNAVTGGVFGIIDGLFNALTGQNQTGLTAEQAAGQVGQLAATTASSAAAIADLQNTADGDANGGLASTDDLERVNTTGVGPGWDENYSLDPTVNGRFTISDGHQAAWVDSSNAVNTAIFRRTDPADAITQTDHQKVGMVIGTYAGEGPQFGASSVNSIYGRMSADETQYVVASVYNGGGGDVVVISYRNGATSAVLGQLNSPEILRTAGATFYLICGTEGDVNTYQVVRNGSVILTAADSAGAVAVGANNRGWGWGGASGNRLAGQATPASVTRLTIADTIKIN